TASNTSNGQSPALFFDNGFPASSTACGGNCFKIPPFIDPTIANGGSPLAVPRKDGLTLPRYQNYSLTFERELTQNMRLDVSYIANRGSRLTAPCQFMGLDANMNDPAALSLGASVLGAQCNLAATQVPANNGKCPGGVALPYPSFDSNVAQALRKYPQYQNII